MAKAQPQTLDYVPAEQKNNMIIETHVVKGILKKHPGKVKKLFFFFFPNVCSHALMGDCHQYTPNPPRLQIQRFHRRIETGKK